MTIEVVLSFLGRPSKQVQNEPWSVAFEVAAQVTVTVTDMSLKNFFLMQLKVCRQQAVDCLEFQIDPLV